MKWILYIAFIISVVTYLFWKQIKDLTDYSIFYIGNALFIFLICTYLYIKDSKSIIIFILASLSLNNVLDEIFFDNTELQLNEILTTIAIITFAFYKFRNDRKRTNNIK